jgi:hypothetical protein
VKRNSRFCGAGDRERSDARNSRAMWRGRFLATAPPPEANCPR